MTLSTDAASRKDAIANVGVLQHRHFAAISKVIACLEPSREYSPDEITAYFAQALRATNPRFDRARFLRACGVAE